MVKIEIRSAKGINMSQKDLYKALGPIAPLFEDSDIMTIMADGPELVTVEKNGKIEDAGIRFKSNDGLKEVIEKVLKVTGVEIEAGKTVYDVRMTDKSRIIAVLSPTAINGHSLVLRKWLPHTISWEKLLEYKAVSPEMVFLIRTVLKDHVNILIAGGTASGKTTMANCIVESIPPEERVVAVEQTHEFQFRHPRAVFLELDKTVTVNMDNLLTTASKMRPDWLIVGELMGAEAMRTMQIFSSGHSGITTIHANSVENALARLEAMCLMANSGLGPNEIREMIVSSLRLILYQECLKPNKKRKLAQVVELCGLEKGRYILNTLVRYDAQQDEFIWPGTRKPSW